MPKTDTVFALGPQRQAGEYISTPIQSTLLPAEVGDGDLSRGQLKKVTLAVTPNFGEIDTTLAAIITPDSGTDPSVLFDLELQMSEKAIPDDSGWTTLASATGMPAFWTGRDGALRSPEIRFASTKVTAKFLRLRVVTTARARWGASIEVV